MMFDFKDKLQDDVFTNLNHEMTLRYYYYLSLLELSYNQLVDLLKQKYGPVTDDYFREESYQKFLKGKIKHITRGNYSRAAEGLYTHHIAETKYENLNNQAFIKNAKYDFNYQRSNQLIYCDLFEHLILHAHIYSESDGKVGIVGYEIITELAEEWFLTDMVPKPSWMKAAYNRAFLSKNLTLKILATINKGKIAKMIKQDQDERQAMADRFREYLKEQTPEKIAADRAREEAEKQKETLEKEEAWKAKYPMLVTHGLKITVTRKKILKLLYTLKYHKQYSSLAEFTTAQLSKYRETLMNDLESVYQEQKNSKD